MSLCRSLIRMVTIGWAVMLWVGKWLQRHERFKAYNICKTLKKIPGPQGSMCLIILGISHQQAMATEVLTNSITLSPEK